MRIPFGCDGTRRRHHRSGGIWTRWTSVRKLKEGETTNDIFAFLTTEPNNEVGAIHPNAMPVVLTAREEIDVWMNAQQRKRSSCKGRFPTIR